MWNYLFDSERRQRDDIDSLHDEAAELSDAALSQQSALASLRLRTGRLELAVKALLWIIEAKLGVSDEELASLVQRIDLSDGFEDGQLGVDLSERAPKCPSCARPVNPNRHRCIYCDAALDVEEAVESRGGPYRLAPASKSAAEPPEPPEMVPCAVCGEVIKKQDASTSAKGPVCARCVWKVDG